MLRFGRPERCLCVETDQNQSQNSRKTVGKSIENRTDEGHPVVADSGLDGGDAGGLVDGTMGAGERPGAEPDAADLGSTGEERPRGDHVPGSAGHGSSGEGGGGDRRQLGVQAAEAAGGGEALGEMSHRRSVGGRLGHYRMAAGAPARVARGCT